MTSSNPDPTSDSAPDRGLADRTAQRAAERQFEAGRFADALAAWTAIAVADPESQRARGRIAACLVGLGRHAEALEVLDPLVTAVPAQPLLAYRQAIARAATGDADGAISSLEAAAGAGLRPMCGIDDEPAFDRLRRLPAYAAVRDRIARNDAMTADEPGFRSFDFWVGTWEARTDDGVLQGHNRIEVVLGGAAIIERWTGATGYRGTSLNRFDRRTGTWRQTWVDDQGQIVEFIDGVATAGRVAFSARDNDGTLRRLTFEDRGPNAFRQVSETSADGGQTWTVEYDFHYGRIPPCEAELPAGDPPTGPRATSRRGAAPP